VFEFTVEFGFQLFLKPDNSYERLEAALPFLHRHTERLNLFGERLSVSPLVTRSWLNKKGRSGEDRLGKRVH
jgi:hypothetical protein